MSYAFQGCEGQNFEATAGLFRGTVQSLVGGQKDIQHTKKNAAAAVVDASVYASCSPADRRKRVTLRQKTRLSFGMLRGFEVAARRLSFTAAASDLCITQSAVSRQIQTLEEQLGTTLFQRQGRSLELTASGQVLLAAVQDASRLIDNAVARIDVQRANAELVVNVAGPFASCWLVPRLARFMDSYPGCNVRIETTNDVTPMERNGCDLAIWHFSPGAASRDSIRLIDDEIVPVCSPSLLRSSKRPLRSVSDLADHVLIQFAPTVNNRALIDWFRWRRHMQLENMVPAGTISFSQYDQVLSAVLDGSGVALGRLPLVSSHLREGGLETPFSQASIVTGAWHAVPAPNAVQLPHVRAFLDWLRNEADSERSLGR